MHKLIPVLPVLILVLIPPVAQADDVVARVFTTDPPALTELRRDHDFWGLRLADGYAVVRLEAEAVESLRAAGLRVEVDRRLTAELDAPLGQPDGAGIPGFPCYRTVEETFADLAQVALDHPEVAQWIDIGDSWEKLHGPGPGYDVQALVLTRQPRLEPKPAFVLIAAMHAREYSTAELATRFAEELAAGYDVDPEATWLLDHHEVHIVPQLNPDGRKQAEAGLSWRKNVNNDFCSNTSTRGIDLNRNSTFFWGGSGSSGDTCSLVFRGPSAASEPETETIEAYLSQVLLDQRGADLEDAAPAEAEGLFISLHSFGELVLYPWEGIAAEAPNAVGLTTLGRKFGFFTGYSVCQDCLGVAAGTAVDIAYGEYGVAAYTFELGTTFFQSCSFFENDILPANLPALRYAAKATRRPYQNPSGPEVLDPLLSAATVEQGLPVTLTASADDGRFASGGFGDEPTQNIAAAYYTVDLPPWEGGPGTPLSPSDGAFDETAESVVGTIETSGLTPGRHLVFVYAEDADGNLGVPTAVFLDVLDEGLIFYDGFESGDPSAWQ